MTDDLITTFARIASTYNDRTAIILPAAESVYTLTYGELNQRRLAIATALSNQHHVARGDRVGIVQSQQPDTIAALLGILSLGASYVPIDADLPEERISFIRRDAGITLCLRSDHDAYLDAIPISTLAGAPREFARVEPEMCAYIMYTSGSTGEPKGVMVPHRAVHRLAVATNFMRLDSSTRFLQLAPQSFDAATLEIWGPLLNGGVVILYPEKLVDPNTVQRMVQSHKVNAMWLTAALFNQFVSRWPEALEGLETLLFGGERASITHVRAAFERYPNTTLINGYGPTENTTFTCCHKVTAKDVGPDATDLPIGTPISGTAVLVVDEYGNKVAAETPGELLAGGRGLALGYVNRDDLNREKFLTDSDGNRWYRTGDLACERHDGVVLYLGRIDRQLKIDGHRIEPGEVEVAILKAADIREVHVVARETPGEKRLVAYIAGGFEPGQFDKLALRHQLAQTLPTYMIPSVFVTLDELPVTANGKVDVARLPSPFPAGASSSRPLTGTDLANSIASVWRSVVSGLVLDSFDENFFDVGGTSMDMLRVKEQLDSNLLQEIPIVTLFTYPTINKLAAKLARDANDLGVSDGSNRDSIEKRAQQRRKKLTHKRLGRN